MRNVTVFNIKLDAPDKIPNCSRNLIFTGRAHADNHFHAFADVLFPLFLTSHQFDGNVIFLVTYQFPPWISGYGLILKKLSKYDVVNIDEEHEVLCFTRTIVGLKSPLNLYIHPNESTSVSMGSFSKFVLVVARLRARSRNKSSSDAHNIEESQSKIDHAVRGGCGGSDLLRVGSQDLRLDLDRFKKTLFKVSEILDS
ncbi:hypothetical protein ACS0TY_035932 [Phlomoides rotata]